MNFTACQVVWFIVLLAGIACIITAIATDYWEYRYISDMKGFGKISAHRGLIQSCHECTVLCGLLETKTCHYRFASFKVEKDTYDVSYKSLEVWEISVLALMCASAFIGLVSLVSSFCCCNRCPWCLGILIAFATACATAGLAVYAWKCGTGDSNTIRLVRPDSTHEFGWSFWVGVAGTGLKLIAGIGFALVSRNKHSNSMTI